MSFEQVNLSDIVLEKQEFAQIPTGDYVFQIQPGVEFRTNKYTDQQELSVSAAISEGPLSGRRVWFTYPDPTAQSKAGKSQAWSGQALKKLEIALGSDAMPGENSKDYLNRVAMNGHSRFSGTMVEETRKNKETGEQVPFVREGESSPRTKLSIFSVGPAQ